LFNAFVFPFLAAVSIGWLIAVAIAAWIFPDGASNGKPHSPRLKGKPRATRIREADVHDWRQRVSVKWQTLIARANLRSRASRKGSNTFELLTHALCWHKSGHSETIVPEH
jgi:hypothetical protein